MLSKINRRQALAYGLGTVGWIATGAVRSALAADGLAIPMRRPDRSKDAPGAPVWPLFVQYQWREGVARPEPGMDKTLDCRRQKCMINAKVTMMNRSLVTAVAVASLLTGCERSDPATAKETQPEGADQPGSDSAPVRITTSSGVAMVYLPGGEFMMGDDRGNPDEAPAHRVKLSAFLMDQFEVTHEMFTKAQLPNPSHWQDNPQKPVERVRWRDAKRYCNERSLLEGSKPCYNEKTSDWDCDPSATGYRLPTEAEWEYACRAGTASPYDFGRADKLRQYAWFSENADQKTHPVGQKKPNGFGIHDLYGNVSEWCEDVYSPAYYQTSPTPDPPGPPGSGKDVRRVIRGGSWKSSADQCRASVRQGERTGDTDACFSTDYCGFRCVRRVTPQALLDLRKTTPSRLAQP